jgi:RNA polymerase sigma-70 factor (ECF subfamily)
LNATFSRPNQFQVNNANGEAAWVAGAKAGYALCFEELVRRNQGRIFRLALHIMQNRKDAEDVLQETFLKAYQHLHQFRGDSRFSTWLVRIAINEARMKLRKRGPNQVTLDEPIETEDDLLPREIEDWGPSPEQKYAQTELQQILSEAISKLKPAFRIVLLLRDVENLSGQETAELLGLSLPAVKSRLLRARLQLRSNLDKYFRPTSLPSGVLRP